MELDDLRRTAQDAARAEKWDELLTLTDALRADTELWASVWAVACALAARTIGQPDRARSLLDEAIAGGYFQVEIFEPELTDTFGADDDWPALRAAILANTPPPPITLRTWPTVRPTAPYTLFRLPPERETLLRDRVPAPLDSAWATAQALLAWVAKRWVHTTAKHAEPDALVILDLVDTGARFACLEYATVLSQALNAVGIPARRIGLRTATHHAGVGSGHMVAEAWIDDLGRWVVLDGQNGLYWVDAAGAPLGVVDLQNRFRAGADRSGAVFLSTALTDGELDLWWTYFAAAVVNDVAWGVPGIIPFFEGAPQAVGPLLADPTQAYPDFTELVTTAPVHHGRAAILPQPIHPYAIGYRITDGTSGTDYALDEPWPIPLDQPGEHRVEIATRTPYGPLGPSALTFTVS